MMLKTTVNAVIRFVACILLAVSLSGCDFSSDDEAEIAAQQKVNETLMQECRDKYPDEILAIINRCIDTSDNASMHQGEFIRTCTSESVKSFCGLLVSK